MLKHPFLNMDKIQLPLVPTGSASVDSTNSGSKIFGTESRKLLKAKLEFAAHAINAMLRVAFGCICNDFHGIYIALSNTSNLETI